MPREMKCKHVRDGSAVAYIATLRKAPGSPPMHDLESDLEICPMCAGYLGMTFHGLREHGPEGWDEHAAQFVAQGLRQEPAR